MVLCISYWCISVIVGNNGTEWGGSGQEAAAVVQNTDLLNQHVPMPITSDQDLNFTPTSCSEIVKLV